MLDQKGKLIGYFFSFLTPTSTIKTATPMLKKLFHNHYFYQTNPKPQPKPKTNLKKQPEKMFLHTKPLQQQPKQNPKKAS
jgi:hypothetical protein